MERLEVYLRFAAEAEGAASLGLGWFAATRFLASFRLGHDLCLSDLEGFAGDQTLDQLEQNDGLRDANQRSRRGAQKSPAGTSLIVGLSTDL
jgi:hypothetical protein